MIQTCLCAGLLLLHQLVAPDWFVELLLSLSFGVENSLSSLTYKFKMLCQLTWLIGNSLRILNQFHCLQKSELSYKSNEAKVNYISSNPYSSLLYLRLKEGIYCYLLGDT